MAMESLILFGGSFDPIHDGHLRIANAASFLLNADVVFVPSKNPRWKNPAVDVKHRLNMLRLAIKQKGMSGTIISDYEIRSKEDINYTIDTVHHFLKKHPTKNLYLLIGADQVNKFHQWREAKQISTLVKIIYVARPGYEVSLENVTKYQMERLDFEESGDIASKDIRLLKTLAVPSTVLDYMEKHSLYFFEKVKLMLPPSRYEHSLSVARLAKRIAFHNRLEIDNQAYIAGLLHDLAKGISSGELALIMKEQYPQYAHLPPFSFHQFVGEYLAKEVFNISDEEILGAIKFHATGKEKMSTLGKIVYSADKIDPLRKFNSSNLIKGCYQDYNLGFIEVLRANKEYLLSTKKDINNELTKACMDFYLTKGD